MADGIREFAPMDKWARYSQQYNEEITIFVLAHKKWCNNLVNELRPHLIRGREQWPDERFQTSVLKWDKYTEHRAQMWVRCAIAFCRNSTLSDIRHMAEFLAKGIILIPFNVRRFVGTTDTNCSIMSYTAVKMDTDNRMDIINNYKLSSDICVGANSIPEKTFRLRCKILENQMALRHITCPKLNGCTLHVTIDVWNINIYEALAYLQCQDRSFKLTIWVSDAFMDAVESDGSWGLYDDKHDIGNMWKQDYEAQMYLLTKYGYYIHLMKARDLYHDILKAIIKYKDVGIIFKDTVNRYNVQRELGPMTTGNSNILQHSTSTTPSESFCAALNLKWMVITDTDGKLKFSFDLFEQMTKFLIKRMDSMLPKDSTHRCLALGYDGLTDVYKMLHIAYESDNARKLNIEIAETMYYGALQESKRLAKHYGPYSTFSESPMSFGKFSSPVLMSSEKEDIRECGVRNATRIGLTSLCNNNLHQFNTDNSYLADDLKKLKRTSKQIIHKINQDATSVQQIYDIPLEYRDIHKLAWEVPMKLQLERAAARQPYIDQCENIIYFLEDPNEKKVAELLEYAWKLNLKVGLTELIVR